MIIKVKVIYEETFEVDYPLLSIFEIIQLQKKLIKNNISSFIKNARYTPKIEIKKV